MGKHDLYQNYIKIMDLLNLHYIRLDEEELQKLQQQDKIDIVKSFEKLLDFHPIIPSRNIDNYIVNNLEVWNSYKKDFFFQYAYMVIGKYTFDNKQEFLYYLTDIYNALYELNITKIKEVLKEISEKKITKFVIDQQQIDITNQLNKIFKNETILNIIDKKLNDKEQFCNVFGSCIENVKGIIEKIIFIVLLFKDTVNEQEIVSLLVKEENLNEYIEDKIINQLAIKDKNNLIEKQKVLDFVYHQLVEEGYYLHGTSSNNKQSILTNGFSSLKIPIMKEEIQIINSIFEKHNLYMNFEGKMRELKLHQYYVTDSVKSSVMHAFQSPEYLSRFCSNGIIKKILKYLIEKRFGEEILNLVNEI